MKKILLTILLFPILLFGQYNSAAFNIGYFNPSAIDGGLILGYKGEKFADRNLSFGWNVSWFHKEYIDQVLLSEAEKYYGVLEGSLIESKATTNLHSIPIMCSVTSYFPFTPFADIFVTGGVGLEGLIISYNNLQNETESDIKTAWDIAWEIGTGVSYKLGKRSRFYGELSYHDSNPSWNFKVYDPNTGRTRFLEQSFDMRGIALKFGVKFMW